MAKDPIQEMKDAAIKKAEELAADTAEVLTFLRLESTQFDRFVRSAISRNRLTYTATKTILGIVPHDGSLIDGYTPAYEIDNRGKPGKYAKRFEYPGFRYTFYVGFDPVVITVTICQDDNHIFPVMVINHENGRFHEPDYVSIPLADPSNEELRVALEYVLGKFVEGDLPRNRDLRRIPETEL